VAEDQLLAENYVILREDEHARRILLVILSPCYPHGRLRSTLGKVRPLARDGENLQMTMPGV
jgi:hypothetical protein